MHSYFISSRKTQTFTAIFFSILGWSGELWIFDISFAILSSAISEKVSDTHTHTIKEHESKLLEGIGMISKPLKELLIY